MNPLILSVLVGFLRYASFGLATWMVENGVTTPEQNAQLIAGLALGLATLGWMVYVKYKDRVFKMTALAMPPNTTEVQLNQAVADGSTAPVTTPSNMPPRIAAMFIAIVLGSSVVTGCAGNTKPIPPVPAIVTQVDTDVRSGAIKALGILGAAGQVLDRVSAIEAEMATSGAIPPAAHAQLTTAFRRVATAGLDAISRIEKGVVVQWADLKATVDPVVAALNPLIELLKTSSPGTRERLLGWTQVALELVSKIITAPKIGDLLEVAR